MADAKRRNSSRHGGRPARSRWRTLVVATAGLALIASAYQFAFATGPVGFLPDYGPTTDTGDTTGSGPGGVGGGSLSRGSLAMGSASRDSDALIGALAIGAFSECKETLPALPADQSDITSVELRTANRVVEAGTAVCFHLHGRSAKDGQWYDLTNRSESRIDLASPQADLIRQQGSSHRFVLPVTVGTRVNNQSVIVVGRFQGNGTPLVAETSVTLHSVK